MSNSANVRGRREEAKKKVLHDANLGAPVENEAILSKN